MEPLVVKVRYAQEKQSPTLAACLAELLKNAAPQPEPQPTLQPGRPRQEAPHGA